MIIFIIKALVLGFVEGVTEFLPISSTGHLILINQWISFGDSFTKMFDIVIQLGAILAVIVYFWSKLWPFGKEVSAKTQIFSIWKKIIIGVIPAIVIGGLLGSFIEKKLFNPIVVACALIIGGIILILVERRQVNNRFESVVSIPWMTALSIGLIQCFSMIPGTSRAAATIVGAILLGATRSVAVEYSFFLAIPTMIAASAYSLLKHGAAVTGFEYVLLAVGFVTAFFVALAAIKLFIGYIKSSNFKLFGYYRIILGSVIVIYFLLFMH